MKDSAETTLCAGVICGDMTSHIDNFRKFVLCGEAHGLGMYYFGIMASACYFESLLENFVVLWCRIQGGGSDDELKTRLYDMIASDVARAAGLDAWRKWIETLFGIDLVATLGDKWKPLTILFKLRNQMAHGRTTKFTHYWRPDGRFVGMTIKGSPYEEIFIYLRERNVIAMDGSAIPSSETILTRAVVAHFHDVVNTSIETLQKLPALAKLAD